MFYTNGTKIKGLFLYKWNPVCRALFYVNGAQDKVHCSIPIEPRYNALFYVSGTQDTEKIQYKRPYSNN
jgi:hypothetical protein